MLHIHNLTINEFKILQSTHSQTYFSKGNLYPSHKGVKLTATTAPKLNTKDPILLTIRS